MPRVRTERALVKVREGRFAVDIIGDNPCPVLGAALTGGPLGESLKFPGRVPTVVPALTAAAFPLVLEIPLEGTPERSCFGLLTGGVVTHTVSAASELSK